MAFASENNANSSKNVSNDGKPDWMLAKEGIQLLLNNNVDAANELFLKKKDSLVLYSGYSMSVFMEALMTLEDDKLTNAINVLREVERRCSADGGWLKMVRSKVFGISDDDRHTLADELETQIILADSLVCIAILTFMQQDITGYFKGSWVLRRSWKIYQSSFNEIHDLYKKNVGDFELPETLSGIFYQTPSAGESDVVAERNSQGSSDEEKNLTKPNGYINSVTTIPHSKSALLTRTSLSTETLNYPESVSPDPSLSRHSGMSSPNSSDSASSNSSHSKSHSQKLSKSSFLKKSMSVNSALSNHLKRSSSWSKFSPFPSAISLSYFTSPFSIFTSSEKLKMQQIDKDTIIRLMGAVTFGYGLFQLGISLLPPSLLKFTNLLGFKGNRKHGTACLMFARLGVDMRAPLASLALLWYYTIVRPFYALDGANIKAGVDFAERLIDESRQEYGDSALFLFFKGRVFRLQSNLPSAIKCFQQSIERAEREIRNLSLHEVGWCHLIQLEFKSAEETFNYLKTSSRWSRQFYTYLSAICCGCYNACTNGLLEFKENVTKDLKGNQLNEFLTRRANCCPSTPEELAKLNVIYWKLLVYEMLYLWNALPSCNTISVRRIIEDSESVEADRIVEPMRGLSKLILGCTYCLEAQNSKAIECFRRCLELRAGLPYNAPDAHISAFSQYELGCLLTRSSQTQEEGKQLLSTINQYKDYDFEQRLTVRIHSLLKHL